MSETIKLNFVRPVKVKKVVDKVAGEVTVNKINRDGGEFGAPREKDPHKGLDFLSYYAEVEASGTGIVVYSGIRPGHTKKTNYGDTVIIEHTTKAGEYNKHVYTLYAHLSKRLVSMDKKIEQGDKIGISGNTGTWQYYFHKKFGEYPKVWNEELGEEVTTMGFHLHFEVIVSPKKIDWNNNDAWLLGNTFRINPETALTGGVEVKYTEPEREVTEADSVKFAQRLRIVEKRDRIGTLISYTVWAGIIYAGRLDINTGEIELDIPMSEFFAIVDGPKPMRSSGDARFDVKVG